MIMRSLASRLSLWVLVGSALILAATGGLLFHDVHRQILRHTEGEASALASEAGHRIEQRLARVSDTARVLAGVIGLQPSRAQDMLREAMTRNSDFSGLSAAFAPAQHLPHSPFASRHDDGSLGTRDLQQDTTPYWQQPWFVHGSTCHDGCWQHPFFSQSRQRLLINYSATIEANGQTIGVLNADVTLDWLHDVLQTLRKPAGSTAFLLDGDNHFLAHDDPAQLGQPAPAGLLQALQTCRRASVHWQDHPYDQAMRVYCIAVEGTPWRFGLAVPENLVYADAQSTFQRGVILGLLALLALTVFTLAIVRRNLRPLATLTARAEQVAHGALSFELPPVRRPDEIGRLTLAFDHMRIELAQHLAELTRNAREQQRLASELEIAHQIQTALLPSEHYHDRHGDHFELHAVLRPARAVGGDLYSYFRLADRRFCVMVGDVSDKGIPAALFMARSITLAKTLAPRAQTPQQLLSLLNRELCRNNDSCMFTTLLCGMLDTETGELQLASAGHEPPALCDAHGSTRLIELDTGAALGLDEDATYPAHALTLHAGDTLLMYTDGITEANNVDNDMYSPQRMLDCLAQCPQRDAANLVNDLLADVDQFAGEAHQSDDITVLALHWGHASHETEPHVIELQMPAAMPPVFAALDRSDAALCEHGVPDALRHDLRVVLEELMVNMVQHGHQQDASNTITLQLKLVGDHVQATLHHHGAPFNPLQAAAPALPGDLADHDGIGGLGIHLARSLAGHVGYQHDAQGNHLQLRFPLSAYQETAHGLPS